MAGGPALADGIDPGSLKAVMGWLAGLATATVGAVGLWLAQRVLGKAAFQTAINDGFSKLTAELQEERDRLRAEVERERLTFTTAQIAWSTERAQLQGRIRQLEQTVQGLERRLGIEPSTAAPPEPGADRI